jgi:hypothetical protein
MNRPATPDRDRGAREHRHEFALTARARALPARQLHRVRGVEHDRAAVSRMIASERMSDTRLL